MAVPGNWTLYYNWGLTGAYGNTPMTVNANDTWTNGQGYNGTWFQVAGMFVFQFTTGTVYAGNIAYMAIVGTQRASSGGTGAFYMLQQGATEAAVAAGAADSNG
jgi:hypothetical protein